MYIYDNILLTSCNAKSFREDFEKIEKLILVAIIFFPLYGNVGDHGRTRQLTDDNIIGT